MHSPNMSGSDGGRVDAMVETSGGRLERWRGLVGLAAKSASL